VLLARPGAGKSTQAERLAAYLGVTHVATGALLRREVASSSSLGHAVAPALEHGDLAPDELVAAVIRPGLEEGAASGGCVLDGFPRDLAQAKALAAFSSSRVAPQVAVSLEVSCEECRRRLLARAGVDARSGGTPETIDRRLAAYERDMAPVFEYYQRWGLLILVDSEGSPEQVTRRILERLGLRRPTPGRRHDLPRPPPGHRR
jgi:adenylate kinase